MKELTTYNFAVTLEYLDEYKSKHEVDCYCVPFQVLAEDYFKARTMLEKWLENPKQTGYKFKTWLGIAPMASNSIIVQDEINVNDYIKD